jgi:hypothetical protein
MSTQQDEIKRAKDVIRAFSVKPRKHRDGRVSTFPEILPSDPFSGMDPQAHYFLLTTEGGMSAEEYRVRMDSYSTSSRKPEEVQNDDDDDDDPIVQVFSHEDGGATVSATPTGVPSSRDMEEAEFTGESDDFHLPQKRSSASAGSTPPTLSNKRQRRDLGDIMVRGSTTRPTGVARRLMSARSNQSQRRLKT